MFGVDLILCAHVSVFPFRKLIMRLFLQWFAPWFLNWMFRKFMAVILSFALFLHISCSILCTGIFWNSVMVFGSCWTICSWIRFITSHKCFHSSLPNNPNANPMLLCVVRKWRDLPWSHFCFRSICLVPHWVDSWLRSLLSARTSPPECIPWSCVIPSVTHPSLIRHGQLTGKSLWHLGVAIACLCILHLSTILHWRVCEELLQPPCFFVPVIQLLVDACLHVEKDCSWELLKRTCWPQNGGCYWLHGGQSKLSTPCHPILPPSLSTSFFP